MARESYMLGASIAERLEFYSMPEPNSGCYLWLGRSRVRDYGRLKVSGRNVLAHRLAYEQRHGAIGAGTMVLHRCDNPACVNPDHLFAGSQVDNIADMVAKGRHRPSPDRGSAKGSAKLTEADIPLIRADRRRYKAIGEAYGITVSTVCNIKSRKTWTHVGEAH